MKSQFFNFKETTLTVEQDRTTLSVTEVEASKKAGSEPDDEQTGKFKRYALVFLYRLLQYLPVVIKFLLASPEMNQW